MDDGKYKFDIELVDGVPTNVSGRDLLDGAAATISPEAFDAVFGGMMISEPFEVLQRDVLMASLEVAEA